MQLQLTPSCIYIHISQHSKHYPYVLEMLHQKRIGKSYWVNQTLINFSLHNTHSHRKAFLTTLYYFCSKMSHKSDVSFLNRLISRFESPIKLMIKPTHIYQEKNPYEILHAHHNESFASIRKKYLRLAKQYHPDSTRDSNDCTAKFQEIQEAYETIKATKKEQNVA